jgi:peptidoglycan/xylan/chitin deacetylase (PgdA/CDA1 family)
MLPLSELDAEIAGPKAILEDALGRAVRSFAYPFGYFSRRVRDAVARAGYESACRVDHVVASTGDDRLSVPRLIVTSSTTTEALATLCDTSSSSVTRALAHAKRDMWRTVRRIQTRQVARS